MKRSIYCPFIESTGAPECESCGMPCNDRIFPVVYWKSEMDTCTKVVICR